VIYAECVGKSTFTDWKRQKQEERRMDATERILTLAYRLRHNLDAVRHINIAGGELAKAEAALKASPDYVWDSMESARLQRSTSAMVVKQRLAQCHPETQEVWSLRPIALAIFGPSVDLKLHDLWLCHTEVAAAAEIFSEVLDDRNLFNQLRAQMFSTGRPMPLTKG
jgi:hypothetical protein